MQLYTSVYCTATVIMDASNFWMIKCIIAHSYIKSFKTLNTSQPVMCAKSSKFVNEGLTGNFFCWERNSHYFWVSRALPKHFLSTCIAPRMIHENKVHVLQLSTIAKFLLITNSALSQHLNLTAISCCTVQKRILLYHNVWFENLEIPVMMPKLGFLLTFTRIRMTLLNANPNIHYMTTAMWNSGNGHSWAEKYN